MKLTDQVEHFLYTHPVQHHKKALVELVRAAEEVYLRRIAELENDLARVRAGSTVLEESRMVAEGQGGNQEDDTDDDDIGHYLHGTRYYDGYDPH